jgi:hypothetical protein
MPAVCAECIASGILTCRYAADAYAPVCQGPICAVLVGDSVDRGDGMASEVTHDVRGMDR